MSRLPSYLLGEMKAAHAHLISALWGELANASPERERRSVRVLEVGCGYGDLISDLLSWATSERIELEVYGFEVFDHRAMTPGYYDSICHRLTSRHEAVDWRERIRLGAASESWPFDGDFFDVAISNQVIEHVKDLAFFFSQIRRVVRSGGLGLHFFPVRASIIEPHSGVPLAHWIPAGKSRSQWIRFCSRLGLGKYRRYRKERGSSLDGFSEEFCNYLERFVYFRSTREIMELASENAARSGYLYDWPLSKRFFSDDWEPYPYLKSGCGAPFSAIAPFSSVTLRQTF